MSARAVENYFAGANFFQKFKTTQKCPPNGAFFGTAQRDGVASACSAQINSRRSRAHEEALKVKIAARKIFCRKPRCGHVSGLAAARKRANHPKRFAAALVRTARSATALGASPRRRARILSLNSERARHTHHRLTLTLRRRSSS
jgi:hypothetical protein